MKGTFNCSVDTGSRTGRKAVVNAGLRSAKAENRVNHLVVEKGKTNAST